MLNPRNKNRTSLFRWMVLSAQFPLNTGKLYAFVRLGLVASVSYQHFLLDSTLLRMPSLRGRWSKVEGEEEIQWRESNSSLAHARLILPSQPATLAGHYFVYALNKYLQHSSYVYEKACQVCHRYCSFRDRSLFIAWEGRRAEDLGLNQVKFS